MISNHFWVNNTINLYVYLISIAEGIGFHSLPLEIVFRVLDLLGAEEIVRVCITCSLCYNLASDNRCCVQSLLSLIILIPKQYQVLEETLFGEMAEAT